MNEALSKVKRLIKLCGFQAVQLHGDETVILLRENQYSGHQGDSDEKTTVYNGFQGFPVAAYLLDSYNKSIPGGTGQNFQFSWARKAVQKLPAPVLIAGGLTSDNVQKAIRSSHAFGVDVSSGVEIRPGLKDPRKVSLFIRRAQNAFHTLEEN